MKRFLKNIVLLFIFIFLVLNVLDTVYTFVYSHSFPRNKTEFVLSLNEGEKLDYVFLGSSRVQNFIISSEIKKLTNKKTINLGTPGGRLSDMNLLLRLLIDKNIKIERLFVQVDYIYNFETSSDIVRSQALPYIRSNTIIKDYLKRLDSNYIQNYYVPFYRYAVNDYILGFRKFLASVINKKSKIDFKDGFEPLYGTMYETNVSFELPKTIAKSNTSLIEIDSLCKMNKIKVTYFCSPICSNLKANNYLSKLKIKLPNFEDFSTSVKNDSLFQDCAHLNKVGAKVFSKIIVDSLKL